MRCRGAAGCWVSVLQLPVALLSGKGNCCWRLGHFCFSVAVWEFGVLAGEGGMGVSYTNSLAKLPCLQLPSAGAGSILENGLGASGCPAAPPPLLLLTVCHQIEKVCKKVSMGKAHFLIISPHRTGSQRDRKRERDCFASPIQFRMALVPPACVLCCPERCLHQATCSLHSCLNIFLRAPNVSPPPGLGLLGGGPALMGCSCKLQEAEMGCAPLGLRSCI